MLDNETDAPAGDALPEDYPGRVNSWPEGRTHIIFGIFGVQAKSQETARAMADEIVQHMRAPGGAGQTERGAYKDAQGYHHELVMAYWLDVDAYEKTRDSDAWSAWWSARSTDSNDDVGVYKEVMHTHLNHFNYAAGTEDKVGCVPLLGLEPSNQFGFWGSYRARIPGSKEDSFKSPLAEMPKERDDVTKGKRLTVELPDNICFIREGQGLAACGPEEKEVWDTQMAGKVDTWTDYLEKETDETGCFSIRFTHEEDIETGKPNMRQSQNAFLISLGHIQKAARNVCPHLEVRQSFIDMYTAPKFMPSMHVWVEVHILKSGDIEAEYVNCHSKTGFLRFFEGQNVA